MKIPAFCAIALAMSASALSQTSVPAAPTLTAGAEFKGLRFDWNKVPGATWYQFEFRAHETGAFIQQGDDYPATATSTHFSFPLHLFDWTYARYRLAACNSAGCSRSAAVSVSSLRRDAVGYFKAATPVQGGGLGRKIDLSPDGYNLVAAAPGEPATTSTGTARGAVYVFRRGSDGKWRQRARLDARNTAPHAVGFGLDVAISASGNTVAVVTSENVDVTQYDYGQVDVYSWKNNAFVRARIPRPDMNEINFVQLDESGSILAVTGLKSSGYVTAIYKLINGAWQNSGTFSTGETCWNLTLSRDGTTLAGTCRTGGDTGPWRDYVRVLSGSNWSTRTEFELDRPGNLDDTHSSHYHAALSLDRTGDTIAVHFGDEFQGCCNSGSVKVYHRAASGYHEVTTFYPGNWHSQEEEGLTFGYAEALSVSGDGHTIAVGHNADLGTGWGPRAAPLNEGTVETGAVYVFRLTDSWKLANMVKPNYRNPASGQYEREFGNVVTLSQSGKTLVVGMPQEDSAAKGIDGNWANASLADSGALFMY